MKRVSLRLNLIRALVPPLAIAVVLIGVFAVGSIYHEVDEVYDATLVQFARTLSRNTNAAPAAGESSHLAHKYERNISYRIFRDGKLLTQSADGFAFDGIEPAPGFSEQRTTGVRWRFFTLVDEKNGYTIQVAEKYSIRSELTLQLLSSLILPGAVFLVAAFAVIWWGVTRGLQRIVKLSEEMDKRAANDLTPISDPTIPAEIAPLFEALNRLFLRITESFAREREFTDNAAHELRTPLAAMKTQTQVLLKTESLTEEGRKGFENLLASIDRGAEMTENLLSFARLQVDLSGKGDVDLSSLVEKESLLLEKQAACGNIKLNVRCEKNLRVRGISHALSLMIRNIIQNAVKFSSANSHIQITVIRTGIHVVLSVSDTGPGIPDEYKQKVFDRFFRINKSAKTGSGLGLAMVKWIVDMHGAEIRLEDNRPAGLVFSVIFKSVT